MKMKSKMIGTLVAGAFGTLTGAGLSVAQAANPSMTFLAAPARPAASGTASHDVVSIRNHGAMTVVVRDPARCGQESRKGSFSVEGDKLQLNYVMPEIVTADQTQCEAVSVFTLHDVPAVVQYVVAQAQVAPALPALPDADHESASMTLLATPATPVAGASKHATIHVRNHDEMVVTVKDPAPCGSRATNSTFRIAGNELQVHYTLEDVSTKASGNCEATAVFHFRNLPHRALQLIATADVVPEPLAKAVEEADPLRMHFLAAPAQVASEPGSVVASIRQEDGMTIVLKDDTVCGERAREPSAQIENGVLHLTYSVAAPTGQQICQSTAVFTVHNLPSGEIKILAEARHP
jgi:hypothetical protein